MEYLLSDEEINIFVMKSKQSYGDATVEFIDIDTPNLLKAQLEKAYPLIRQDVLRDIGEYLYVFFKKEVKASPNNDKKIIEFTGWRELSKLISNLKQGKLE